MTTLCCVCQSKIRGDGEPISHGIHQHCAMLIYPDLQRPVLPKWHPTDCYGCGKDAGDGECKAWGDDFKALCPLVGKRSGL